MANVLLKSRLGSKTWQTMAPFHHNSREAWHLLYIFSSVVPQHSEPLYYKVAVTIKIVSSCNVSAYSSNLHFVSILTHDNSLFQRFDCWSLSPSSAVSASLVFFLTLPHLLNTVEHTSCIQWSCVRVLSAQSSTLPGRNLS